MLLITPELSVQVSPVIAECSTGRPLVSRCSDRVTKINVVVIEWAAI